MNENDYCYGEICFKAVKRISESGACDQKNSMVKKSLMGEMRISKCYRVRVCQNGEHLSCKK